jgi:hypothetical protein
MFAKGPVVRKRIIVSDDVELEVRSRWHFIPVTPGNGATKVILSVKRNGEVAEFRALWAFSDAPFQKKHLGLKEAIEEARNEANWALWEFCYFLSLALQRKTLSLQDDMLMHFRVYRGMQSKDSWALLDGLELAGEWAKLIKIAYIYIRSQIAERRPTDLDDFEKFVGEQILRFADDKEAEVFDLRPILQAKSLAELVLPQSL